MIRPKPETVCHDDTVPRPDWYTCHLKSGTPECGRVLVSFCIVEDDYSFETPLKYMNLIETVQREDYNIELSILGLRDL
jgi:hypothetical protein